MIQISAIQEAFDKFSMGLNEPFSLKNIFFDMDGVLFNSMPHHAKAWLEVFEENNLKINESEPYLNEGATALFTVRAMFRKYRDTEVTEEFSEQIKTRKHLLMTNYPESEVMSGMQELLRNVTKQGIDSWVVTGSAQDILLDRLEKEFPGSFFRNKMITAHDVKIGKPNPEPYLKAMKKSGYKVSECFVVENAPMGVQSAKAAGLFTIAINTGPLEPKVLADAGADLVLSGSDELNEIWPLLLKVLSGSRSFVNA
jgi:HAD superfamily hydrolase (TIGR01509 family)